jgi:hypothetical protein
LRGVRYEGPCVLCLVNLFSSRASSLKSDMAAVSG